VTGHRGGQRTGLCWTTSASGMSSGCKILRAILELLAVAELRVCARRLAIGALLDPSCRTQRERLAVERLAQS